LTKDTTLAGLVGERIFVDSAPKQTAFPFLVYQFITGRPAKGVGKVVIFYEETWQVRAVIDEGSYKDIGTIINRVRTLTDGVEGTGVLSCEEVQTFRFSEYDQGTEYCALGVELLVRTQ
jgi:hypothetical protein